MNVALSVVAVLVVLLGTVQVEATWFYLPGIEAISYKEGQNVSIKVNSLRSLNAMIPYSYYSLPYCRPDRALLDAGRKAESLGEVLWGDDIELSYYAPKMLKNEACVRLPCTNAEMTMNDDKLKMFERLIEDEYRGHMVLDNLPVFNNGSLVYGGQCQGENTFDNLRGFALGVKKSCAGKTLINNHIEFTISYHIPEDTPATEEKKYRVVGFNAVPYSYQHTGGLDATSCVASFNVNDQHASVSTESTTQNIVWTYGVKWVERPDIKWASRWDAYLNTSFTNINARVHWLSIINSLLIVLCLSAIVTMILLRTLHLDFNRYNNTDNLEEGQEEVGWKLVHADVFRPPTYPGLFSICIGTGVQFLTMCLLTLFFALLGFLSPANRGGLLTTLILLYTLQSFFAGYATARILKMFQIKSWKTVFGTGSLFPGVFFTLYLAADIILWNANASSAVPFVTILTLFGLWFLVSLPLVILGASFGFRRPMTDPPRKIAKLCRYIPDQHWYLRPPFTYLVPGVIPFGAAFIELRFIFNSLWQGMVYYVFGFLTLVFFIWMLTTALTTIVLIYYQLCFEDWRWWWRSYFVPGGLGIHFFIYCLYYYTFQLNLQSGASSLLFFTFTGMASIAYGVMVGTLGFFSAILFVTRIYAALHID